MKTLGAKIIAPQTPPSMPSDDLTLKQVDSFFEEAKTLLDRGMFMGREIRGELLRAPRVRDILERHGVIHIVDLFKTRPLYRHGQGISYTNYSYNYTDKDLVKLHDILVGEEFNAAYVMFNNITMWDDAIRFKNIVVRRSREDKLIP